MSLVYRSARAEDLATAEALVFASINDLTVRHGFGPMATTSPLSFQLFSLEDDPDGLWVAEEKGEILGFAWSWVCGDVWFLAQLFVDPARQGGGIGNELLKRTMEHARKSKAVHKALITFTFNCVSQGLYIRHGLFPKMPNYFLDASGERVMKRLPRSPLRSIPIDDSAATLKRLAEIDSKAIGISRERHHRYLLNEPATTAFLLCAGKRLRRLQLCRFQWAHRAPRGDAGRQSWRCLSDWGEAGGGLLCRENFGVPPGHVRERTEPCSRSRHAHHLPNAVDGHSRLWRLDAVPAAKSGFYVMRNPCS